MKKVIGVLLIVLMFGLSFSLASDTSSEIKRIWQSERITDVDPRHALEVDAYVLDSGTLFIEEIEANMVDSAGKLRNDLRVIDNTGKLVAETTIGNNHYSTVFRVFDNHVFYIEKDCDSFKGCRGTIGGLDQNLEPIFEFALNYNNDSNDNTSSGSNDSVNAKDVYDAFTGYGDYDQNSVQTVTKDKDGNYLFYSKTGKYVKISKDFSYVDLITLTSAELNSYFPDAISFANKNANDISKGNYYTGQLELKDGSILYVGTNENDSGSTAYLEVVKDGKVIWKKEDSKYESFSDPILVKDVIVFKANYDKDKLLGSEKADLIMYSVSGQEINIYDKENSYYNTLISYGDYFVTSRVYVDGYCATGENVGTYNLWDISSCSVYRYYEIYEPKVASVFIENPETKALSILLLVVVALGVGMFILKSIKKMREN